ncbi:MAG: sigma-70 family RNA polymerase sigma factor [Acidimicrobiales bacterium]|nr:sigma-70 family RNA polymerase sigma factor [Acidimicrobiales bacterium]
MNAPEGSPGNPDQFDRLVAANFDDVWRFVRRRVHDRDDADDVTAEVFAVAWRRLADLPPESERRLWLFGTARHVLANHDRSRRRRERLQVRIASTQSIDHIELAESDDTLWRGLAALGADDRELLLLRAWEQLTVSDIAALLGCTPNAASQRLATARRRLAAQLADGRTDPGDTGHEMTGSAPTGHPNERPDR